jgi:hypothetical protein
MHQAAATTRRSRPRLHFRETRHPGLIRSKRTWVPADAPPTASRPRSAPTESKRLLVGDPADQLNAERQPVGAEPGALECDRPADAAAAEQASDAVRNGVAHSTLTATSEADDSGNLVPHSPAATGRDRCRIQSRGEGCCAGLGAVESSACSWMRQFGGVPRHVPAVRLSGRILRPGLSSVADQDPLKASGNFAQSWVPSAAPGWRSRAAFAVHPPNFADDRRARRRSHAPFALTQRRPALAAADEDDGNGVLGGLEHDGVLDWPSRSSAVSDSEVMDRSVASQQSERDRAHICLMDRRE